MYLSAPTLDDLLLRILQKLLAAKTIVNSSKGKNYEVGGVLLKLSNPRARLSRTANRGILPSGLGEFLWYMSGRRDAASVSYYIPKYTKFAEDDGNVWGAYGPRLLAWRGHNQLENVISNMLEHVETRQAVIQIFDAEDTATEHKDTPCTCSLQFLARHGRLNMMVTMRSNDAYLGLPHDIFSFTMIQEYVACRLQLRLGWYKHAVGSLHLYDDDRAKAQRYLDEGWQPTKGIAMPAMPESDAKNDLANFLNYEEDMRAGDVANAEAMRTSMPTYWRDLAIVLQAYSMHKSARTEFDIRATSNDLTDNVYRVYIESIARRAQTST